MRNFTDRPWCKTAVLALFDAFAIRQGNRVNWV